MTPRQCAWLKVEVMRGLLVNGATHVGFLDADCEFRPHAPPFEGEYADGISLLMALGKSGRLNTGIMFGRSKSELLDFLDMLISKSDLEVPKEDRTAYENGHFIHYGKSARLIGLLDHQKWNNNSCMDSHSYVQHYSGGELRRWWDSNKKCTYAIPAKDDADKEDIINMPIYEFLQLARDHLSSKYPELVSTWRKVLVN
jgi:hypothetical protein